MGDFRRGGSLTDETAHNGTCGCTRTHTLHRTGEEAVVHLGMKRRTYQSAASVITRNVTLDNTEIANLGVVTGNANKTGISTIRFYIHTADSMIVTIEHTIEGVRIAVTQHNPRCSAGGQYTITRGHITAVEGDVVRQFEIAVFTRIRNGHIAGAGARIIHRVGRIEIEGAARVDSLRKGCQLLRRLDGEWISGRAILRLHGKRKGREHDHRGKEKLFLESVVDDVGLTHNVVLYYMIIFIFSLYTMLYNVVQSR